MHLGEREEEVIRVIVNHYIHNATPVGSRYVARQGNLQLSAATIRNIMADLTEKGYLTQPHTSAGRVPTHKAFRYYIDAMPWPGTLPPEKRKDIQEALQQSSHDFTSVLDQTCRLISNQTSLVGMVISPQVKYVRWQQIDFILVRPGLIVAVLVFQGGIVENRLIPVEEKVTPDDLIKYSNYLNDKFQGQTLNEVKKQILQEMQDAQNKFNVLYSRALQLAHAAFSQEDDREVFVDGTLKVFDYTDNIDISSMRDLLNFLEQRSQLLDILEKISQMEGLTISFGTEFYGPGLEEWSIISSPYRVKGDSLGILGTVGPIHMDYSKLVPTVDYIAKMLSKLLENRFYYD